MEAMTDLGETIHDDKLWVKEAIVITEYSKIKNCTLVDCEVYFKLEPNFTPNIIEESDPGEKYGMITGSRFSKCRFVNHPEGDLKSARKYTNLLNASDNSENS